MSYSIPPIDPSPSTAPLLLYAQTDAVGQRFFSGSSSGSCFSQGQKRPRATRPTRKPQGRLRFGRFLPKQPRFEESFGDATGAGSPRQRNGSGGVRRDAGVCHRRIRQVLTAESLSSVVRDRNRLQQWRQGFVCWRNPNLELGLEYGLWAAGVRVGSMQTATMLIWLVGCFGLP